MKTVNVTLATMIAGILLFSASSAMAMEKKVVGTVMKNGDNYCLLDTQTEYIVLGKDLKPYVGDTVAATGDVYNGLDFPTIHIDSVKIISHKDLITPELQSERTAS